MNHNINDAHHHTLLGLKNWSTTATPASSSDGKPPTREDRSLEDEVFDTAISHPPPILLPKIIMQQFDASYCNNKSSINDELLDKSICLDPANSANAPTSGTKMGLGVVEIDESMSSTNSDEYQLANETNSAVPGTSSANNSSDRIEFALEATKFWDANDTFSAFDKDRERQRGKELGEGERASEEMENVEEGGKEKGLEEEGEQGKAIKEEEISSGSSTEIRIGIEVGPHSRNLDKSINM